MGLQWWKTKLWGKVKLQQVQIIYCYIGLDILFSDCIFILNIWLNKNELKSHRVAAASLRNKGRVLPNEKLGGVVRAENKVGLEWQSVFRAC